MHYHGRQVKLVYEMPMAEVVMDFFDKLKSVLSGLCVAGLRLQEYRAADVVKLGYSDQRIGWMPVPYRPSRQFPVSRS